MATYSTWNPLDKSAVITLSGGNLTAAADGSNWGGVRATDAYKSSGKWYWEVTVNTVGSPKIGVLTDAGSVATGNYVGNSAFGWAIDDLGLKWHSATQTAYAGTSIDGKVVSVLLDLDGGTIGFWINGTDYGTAYSSLSGNFLPAFSGGFSVSNITANFGATAFSYTPPVGYNAGWFTADAFVGFNISLV